MTHGGKVYCFSCVLIGEAQSQSQFQTGFSDWKNSSHRIQFDENNATRWACVQILIRRQSIHGRIDTSLKIAHNEERILDNSFRKCSLSDSIFIFPWISISWWNSWSQHNGNYRRLLELLAEYDPLHSAKYGNVSKGKQSHLSWTIYEKLIEILGSKVLKLIVNEYASIRCQTYVILISWL